MTKTILFLNSNSNENVISFEEKELGKKRLPDGPYSRVKHRYLYTTTLIKCGLNLEGITNMERTR
mgnify:FL=1